MWPNSPAPPLRAAHELPVDERSPPPMPGAEREHQRVRGARGRAGAVSASSAAFASLSTHTGSPSRSAITSRNGTPAAAGARC